MSFADPYKLAMKNAASQGLFPEIAEGFKNKNRRPAHFETNKALQDNSYSF